MGKYTVKATLEITAEGTGASPEEVLEKAIAHKKYTITGYTIGKQAIDRYVTLSEKTGAYVGMYEKRGKKQYEKKKAAREAAKAEQEAAQAPE